MSTDIFWADWNAFNNINYIENLRIELEIESKQKYAFISYLLLFTWILTHQKNNHVSIFDRSQFHFQIVYSTLHNYNINSFIRESIKKKKTKNRINQFWFDSWFLHIRLNLNHRYISMQFLQKHYWATKNHGICRLG